MLYSYKKGIPKELPETITIQETVFEEVTHDVVTDENGIEETITVTETLGRNVETVLSPPFTEEQLSKAGYVLAPEKPADTALVKYEWFGDKWVALSSEAAKLRDKMWNDIRSMRDQSLTISDEIINDFITNDIDIPQEWENYRQQMRDMLQIYMTGEINDYENIIWPERPDYLDSIGDGS